MDERQLRDIFYGLAGLTILGVLAAYFTGILLYSQQTEAESFVSAMFSSLRLSIIMLAATCCGLPLTGTFIFLAWRNDAAWRQEERHMEQMQLMRQQLAHQQRAAEEEEEKKKRSAGEDEPDS